jgi:hypothetical protein
MTLHVHKKIESVLGLAILDDMRCYVNELGWVADAHMKAGVVLRKQSIDTYLSGVMAFIPNATGFDYYARISAPGEVITESFMRNPARKHVRRLVVGTYEALLDGETNFPEDLAVREKYAKKAVNLIR